MTNKTENPLVTFMLLGYNHKEYIRAAVEGALAQTYQPLEIILSDDRSPDETFEIMKAVADEYSGPHTVILNRSEQNMGIANHINHLMKISSGELIVVAAGDDVSLPHRTQRLAQTWVESGKPSGSIYSGYVTVDEHGTETGKLEPTLQVTKRSDIIENPLIIWRHNVLGCAQAWTRDVFEVFGDLNPELVLEDRVIPYRSALLGKVSYINESLLKYRVLSQSLSHFSKKGAARKRRAAFAAYYKRNRNAFVNNQRDLETALSKDIVDSKELNVLQPPIIREIDRSETYRQLLEGGLFTRLRVAIMGKGSFSLRQRLKFLAVAIAPWIYGSPLGDYFVKAKRRWR